MLEAQGVRLTYTQLNRLHSLTEGWAAGLGLAAASLRTGRDADDFITSFAGDTGAMAGYLIEEVLAGLDATTLDFMLLTCVAERLTPELASRLSGRDDAGEILGRLAESNTLVSVTTGSVTTYRYHSLLRGYLSARLKSLGRNRFGQLHAETATWFSEHGLDAEALEHAVVSQDEDITHAMLHRYGVRLVLSGRGSTVGRAIERAPASGAGRAADGGAGRDRRSRLRRPPRGRGARRRGRRCAALVAVGSALHAGGRYRLRVARGSAGRPGETVRAADPR